MISKEIKLYQYQFVLFHILLLNIKLIQCTFVNNFQNQIKQIKNFDWNEGFANFVNLNESFRNDKFGYNQKYDEIFNYTSTTKGLDLDFIEEYPDDFKKRINTIYPGTVWCGMGNSALNDFSIGVFYITDNCCRLHDKCPDFIPPKDKRHGLLNTGIFTRSHCDCDKEFYYCLKDANTIISRKIGITYFNILRPQCFRNEYRIIHCLRWQNRRCLIYITDNTKERVWQWFDNKYF